MLKSLWIAILLGLPGIALPQGARQPYEAYLFTYFTGNDTKGEAIRFAISLDGYTFRALNGNKPVLNSAFISSTGGVRDPHILRAQDGKTFYMIATDMVSAKGWNSNRAMVLMKSTDLINWTSSVVNIQNRFSGNDSLLRVWAPQTIYDPGAKKYMVYFSMKHGKNPDKIYYTYANADFTDLETVPKQLYFSPDSAACIDGDIVEKDGKFHLFYKTEDRKPGIKIAVSDKLTGGYVPRDNYVQLTKDPVEGAGVFKLNDNTGYILMYDVYTMGKYQFTKTKDLAKFEVVDSNISMDFHPRHGTVMPITTQEAERLVSQWMTPDAAVLSVKAKGLKEINVSLDTAARKVYLPVLPETDLKKFKPEFYPSAGIRVDVPRSADFSKGAVSCSVTMNGKPPVKYELIARKDHNPVLPGYYADPDILYSQKTGKFYIYPTSDGFTNWNGSFFNVFSSADMVSWKDEGVILDLPKDVSWAKTNAWAPCIIEKKVGGAYKYYYYFTANKKIGVAVADDPLGPFVDSGKPLIDKFPEGVTRGQQIDPDVFTDPKTNKSYLYWGNGYLAGAELADDMISLKQETLKLLTPDNTYNEGTYVFYRNGKYYFSWSQHDTRDPNYRVRYGTADEPLGKISIPENNIMISRNDDLKIYGTGHHSVIQMPGKDTWYIVYHRFNYPNGINMGRAAGYNREVCIDLLTFDKDGRINPVTPTHVGIGKVSLKGKASTK